MGKGINVRIVNNDQPTEFDYSVYNTVKGLSIAKGRIEPNDTRTGYAEADGNDASIEMRFTQNGKKTTVYTEKKSGNDDFSSVIRSGNTLCIFVKDTSKDQDECEIRLG